MPRESAAVRARQTVLARPPHLRKRPTSRRSLLAHNTSRELNAAGDGSPEQRSQSRHHSHQSTILMRNLISTSRQLHYHY